MKKCYHYTNKRPGDYSTWPVINIMETIKKPFVMNLFFVPKNL